MRTAGRENVAEVIYLDSLSPPILAEIMKVRRAKDLHEEWTVDCNDGILRIQKSRNDGLVYPPGASIEFWRRDSAGIWQPMQTA